MKDCNCSRNCASVRHVTVELLGSLHSDGEFPGVRIGALEKSLKRCNRVAAVTILGEYAERAVQSGFAERLEKPVEINDPFMGEFGRDVRVPVDGVVAAAVQNHIPAFVCERSSFCPGVERVVPLRGCSPTLTPPTSVTTAPAGAAESKSVARSVTVEPRTSASRCVRTDRRPASWESERVNMGTRPSSAASARCLSPCARELQKVYRRPAGSRERHVIGRVPGTARARAGRSRRRAPSIGPPGAARSPRETYPSRAITRSTSTASPDCVSG